MQLETKLIFRLGGYHFCIVISISNDIRLEFRDGLDIRLELPTTEMLRDVHTSLGICLLTNQNSPADSQAVLQISEHFQVCPQNSLADSSTHPKISLV